jgi:hypothetical protein
LPCEAGEPAFGIDGGIEEIDRALDEGIFLKPVGDLPPLRSIAEA